MKILVVGGTGMIGSHIAQNLRAHGNDVAVGARSPIAPDSPVAGFARVVGDYVSESFTVDDLSPFEAIVFAAGHDLRHARGVDDEEAFWKRTQSEGVPRFAALAKRAGVHRFVQIGSYYHQVRPDLIQTNPYVRARALADERARELADADFNVSTLNPPTIVGLAPGVWTTYYEKLLAWTRGDLPDVPYSAPPGGTNYMSARSLAEATWSALQHAEPGAAHLVGDMNLTFREYFRMIFDAAGSDTTIVERDEEHPLLPDSSIVPGRGVVLRYQPDAELDYTRGDIPSALGRIMARISNS